MTDDALIMAGLLVFHGLAWLAIGVSLGWFLWAP